MQLNKNEVQNLEIPDEYKDSIVRFCTELFSSYGNLTGAVLIGSCSRKGDFVPGKSDMDLCLYDDYAIQHTDSLEDLTQKLKGKYK